MTEGPGPAVLRQEVRAENGHAYGAIGADIHVFGEGTPVYLLFAYRRLLGLDGEWLRAQPSRMLDARAEVVDFTGRDTEVGELISWRDQLDQRGQRARTAVRWLHGPGGQGKTRLAARLAADSEAAGWKVVTAVHGTDTAPPAEGSQDLRLDGHTGVLVLVDYADRWPVSHLSWLFHNRLLRQGVPARILLIGRSAHGWPAVRGQLNRLRESIETSDQLLRPLPADGDERGRMFAAARACFAARYPGIPGVESIAPPGPLGHEDFGLTLAVQMAALVAVDARAHGRRPPGDMTGLTAYLLDREHENWRQLHENAAAGLPHRTADHLMRRAVFTAVLTGPVTRPAGRAVLGRLIPETAPDELLSDHAVCYPPTDPARAHVLEPLLPDRLAEDFLALTLPGSPVTGYATDPWAAFGVTALLARGGDGAAAPWTPRAVTFLAEAAGRWPHVGQEHLFPALQRDAGLALDAGSVALASLARVEELSLGVVEGIERAFRSVTGNTRHVDIDTGYAVLAERVTRHRLAVTDDPREQGEALHTLAVRLAHAGRKSEALDAEARSVAYSRAVVTAGRPDDADLHNHAAALNHLSELLTDAGKPEEAVEPAVEAVRVLRKLTQGDQDLYMAPFAHATGTLAALLDRLDRTDQAIEYAETAFRLYQQVMESSRDKKAARHLPDFTAAARRLASLLSGNGRPEEALRLYEGCLEYGRILVEAAPQSELPGLAATLHGLGLTLARLGRHEESLAPILECAEAYRRLEKANPAAFRPGLAETLYDLGGQLETLSRRDDALVTFEEALALYRRLAADSPDRYLPPLGSALTHVSGLLSAGGRSQDAIAPQEEAAGIFRHLAQDTPAYLPDLVDCLNDLGIRLTETLRYAEAVAPAREALEAGRRLAQEDPRVYMPHLATCLLNMGLRHSAVGRPAEAAAVLEEAVGRYRQLVVLGGPAAYSAQLAMSLGTLAEQLAALGRYDEMLGASEESLDLLRPLAAHDPEAHLPEFTRRQLLYAEMRLRARLDLPSALQEALGAVQTYWPTAEQYPYYIPLLKRALTTLADILDALGRHTDADDMRRQRETIPDRPRA
ncbi:tetratricopeptide repeat protein [Streptomyces rectiverticillatus]|uniref:tetratricopeptide repeat protein n=1 Tax=Streptomyces rectiverticillatus TaxID=173860 RepID=UPI0015C36E05|nr:tetratricopeptide repeat protein [Streptomyces rectiverticillatus]QLE70407.1 tetratricopeptide repeat protein [Streptomyces rectiverticillatus]